MVNELQNLNLSSSVPSYKECYRSLTQSHFHLVIFYGKEQTDTAIG